MCNSCFAVYNFLFVQFAENMHTEHQQSPILHVMHTLSGHSTLNLIPLSYEACKLWVGSLKAHT